MIIPALYEDAVLRVETVFVTRGRSFRPDDVVAFTNIAGSVQEGRIISAANVFMRVRVGDIVFECRRLEDTAMSESGRYAWVIYGVERHGNP